MKNTPANTHARLQNSTIHELHDGALKALDPVVLDADGKPKPWSSRARRYMVTWPNCPLSVGEFRLRLRSIDKCPVLYIACRERHRSGEPHFHAMFDMGLTAGARAPKLSSPACFDIRVPGLEPGAETVRYHPNIQAVRNVDRCWHYVCKREDPAFDEVFWDTARCNKLEDPCCSKKPGADRQSPWHTIINMETREDTERALKMLAPKEAMCNFANIKG